jgi:hypothetical protein
VEAVMLRNEFESHKARKRKAKVSFWFPGFQI